MRKGHYTHFFSVEEIKEKFGKHLDILNTFEFKSKGSPLTVRVFFMKKT